MEDFVKKEAIHCINNIDDYLEYLYKHDDKEIMRNKILNFINDFTKRLK